MEKLFQKEKKRGLSELSAAGIGIGSLIIILTVVSLIVFELREQATTTASDSDIFHAVQANTTVYLTEGTIVENSEVVVLINKSIALTRNANYTISGAAINLLQTQNNNLSIVANYTFHEFTVAFNITNKGLDALFTMAKFLGIISIAIVAGYIIFVVVKAFRSSEGGNAT